MHGVKDCAALEMAYLALLRRAVGALGATGIPVMPLKGILFAWWIYDDPSERLRGDIDLLVPEERFDAAIAVLRETGFMLQTPHANGNERTLWDRSFAIEIDLHRSLFARGRYGLPTSLLFTRGKADRGLYGVPVILPDPYDAYAHVVGHAASDHEPRNASKVSRDLALLSGRLSLCPRRCAGHLERSGLARAARYTLTLACPGEPFATEVLRSLRPDPAGAALARAACSLSRRFPSHALPSRLAGFLTNTSLARAGLAGGIAIVNRLRLRNV